MPNNSYLALSFGGTHINADMIVFASFQNEQIAYDMYSTGYGEPVFDDTDDIYDFFVDTSNHYPQIEFTAERDLDTMDAQDFVVE